ncbi:hypothetical protein, partial [uncultured Clostridium sp.]|uniref:hypothetical protein n=1 Tax=uncultured Clostridium sp. TaxID=59620 RepID=UPI00259A78D2
FQYGKFLLPPRFLTALSVPKVPTREPVTSISLFLYFFPNFSLIFFPPNAIMCSIFNLFIKK